MAHSEDFTIAQGADVSFELSLTNKDGSVKNLTGHTGKGYIKQNYAADSSTAITFSVAMPTPTNGIMTLGLTNIQTDAMKTNGQYVYDVELSHLESDITEIERLLQGLITVTPSVTR
jgi:hypothetical protein